MEMELPPIGLRRKEFWKHKRVEEIVEAMYRFYEANKVIPSEWADELSELLHDLEEGV